MIYDSNSSNIPPSQPVPPVRARRRWWLLAPVPLLACLMCAAITVYALLPLRGQVRDVLDGPSGIPVTGEEATSEPTLLPSPSAVGTPDPLESPAPSISPHSSDDYRSVVEAQLLTCYSSLKAIFTLETVAARRPEMINSEDWRTQSRAAMDDFQKDCEPLGTLPTPSGSYSRVDRFLKLAVAEIGPASEELDAVLNGNSSNWLGGVPVRPSLQHLINFVEYAQHAEDALSGLKDRKEI